MILKRGVTTKPQRYFVRLCLLFFLRRYANALPLSRKNKSPDAGHQGFVVDYPDEISNFKIMSDISKVVRFVEKMT